MVIYEKIYKTHGLSKTQVSIINIVGLNKTVLEIGPSTGYMTRAFLKNNCTVDVIENNKSVFLKLPKGIRNSHNFSVEDEKINKLLSKDYDFIILADVLEHLINPEKVLKMLYSISLKKSKLIVSLPNVASWVMRKQLFFKGDFEYTESGILDKTHLHFYTVNSLPRFLLKNGWETKKLEGTIIRLPYEGLVNKLPIINLLFRKLIYNMIVKKFPNLSYYHFFVVAKKNENRN